MGRAHQSVVALAAGSGVSWWFCSTLVGSGRSAGSPPRGMATVGAMFGKPAASEACAEGRESVILGSCP